MRPLVKLEDGAGPVGSQAEEVEGLQEEAGAGGGVQRRRVGEAGDAALDEVQPNPTPKPEFCTFRALFGDNMSRSAFGTSHGSDDDVSTRLRKRKATPSYREDTDSSSDCEVYEPVKKAPDVIVISSDESCDEESGDFFSSDEEWDESKLNKGKRKIKVGKVTIEAFCVDIEDDAAHRPVKDERPGASGPVDENIKIKIRKMLQVGLHPGTPNEEAERSLKLAHNLLQKHNLEEMDVINAGGADGKSKLTGGMKVVELKSKSGHPPNNAAWISDLGGSASACFDCCYFHETGDSSLNYVFYGVVANAEMAAFAFSSSLNRVAHMTAAYTGVEGAKHTNMYVTAFPHCVFVTLCAWRSRAPTTVMGLSLD